MIAARQESIVLFTAWLMCALLISGSASGQYDCNRVEICDFPNDGFEPVDPEQILLTWMPDAGNPGGWLKINDLEGLSAWFRAPADWGGDLSLLNGVGVVRYDQIFIDDPEQFPIEGNAQVLLVGPGGRAVHEFPGPPEQGVWVSYEVALDQDLWNVSEGDWASLLMDVTEIVFVAEITRGHDINGFDNFYIGLPTTPEDDLDGDGIPDECGSYWQVAVTPWDDFRQVMVNPGTTSLGSEVFIDVQYDQGYPAEGLLVEIVIDAACENLCIDPVDPGLSGYIDAGGMLVLNPSVGGCDDCLVQVYVEGYLVRQYQRIVSNDWDGVRGNGLVDAADFQFFEYVYQGAYDPLADYDGDGDVDADDFQFVYEAQAAGCANSEPCIAFQPSCDRLTRFENPTHDWTPDGGLDLAVPQEGGVPYGYLETVDLDGGGTDSWAVAPSAWVADLSGLCSFGMIRFDHNLIDADGGPLVAMPLIELISPLGTATCVHDGPPSIPGEWQTCVLPLDAEFWSVSDGALALILRDLTAIRVLADLTPGQDINGFDNFYIGLMPSPTEDTDGNLIPDPCQAPWYQADLGLWDEVNTVVVAPGFHGGVDSDAVIRDGYGDLRPGTRVDVHFSSNCTLLCIDPMEPNLTGFADASGNYTFNPAVGGCDDCLVEIHLDREVARIFSQVRSPDWDGSEANGRVDDWDLQFFYDSLYGGYATCADYFHDGILNIADVGIAGGAYGATNTELCGGGDPELCRRMCCFNFDANGWTAEPAGYVQANFTGAGGYPGGYLQVMDFGAPEAYIVSNELMGGDLSAIDGTGVVHFDLQLINDFGQPATGQPAVHLTGPGGEAAYTFEQLPELGLWQRYEVDLVESLWTVTSGTWADLLAEVTAVKLNARFTDAMSQSGFDNVRVGPVLSYAEDFNRDGLPDECTVQLVGTPLEHGPRAVAITNFPNPFNPRTTVSFDVPRAAPVRLSVYDVKGRLVRTLVSGKEHAPGSYEVIWSGRDDRGRGVSSGLYLCRLQVGEETVSHRLALLK